MSKGLSISELKKMDKRERVSVYAGGEIRQLTVGHILKVKQDYAKKQRQQKAKKGR